MDKLHKKTFLIFVFCSLVFFGATFTCQKAFALEIAYPELITGARVTDTTNLPNYLKYVFDVGMFVGFFAVFLSLVWAGVLFLFAPASPNVMSDAKDRFSGAISGLLILALLYMIITTINPELSFFRESKLTPVEIDETEQITAGVFLNNYSSCKDDPSPSPLTLSSANLGDLKNRVNSAKIVQDSKNELYYVAVLYDLINYSGMCKYINPNTGCQETPPFADSASVYQYDFSPNGDGVYFYRKSFFNNEGGVQKISNYQIANAKIYMEKLENITYNRDPSSEDVKGCTVPEKDQDCTMWDDQGNCTQKKCPNLGGENITSIRIKGNYIVLLVYQDESGTKDLGQWTWSFCQSFPSKDDVIKNGPNQIKWENIRTLSAGQEPNYVIIIPVKQK